MDDSCDKHYSSVCSIPSTKTLKSDTRLVFTAENITTSAIQVRLEVEPASQNEKQKDFGMLTFSEIDPPTKLASDDIGGFRMKWQQIGLANKNNDDKRSKLEWTIKRNADSVNNLNVMTILNLVRESKIHRIKEHEVWSTFMKHIWDIEILKTNSLLSELQLREVIYKSAQDLKLEYDWKQWITEEDIAFGTELYTVLLKCPDDLTEAAKLSKLFESLITTENLNTVVAATMHNIQPRAGDNIKDFTAINMWYQRLGERYNFSLGPNIQPLMTSDGLRQMEEHNLLYMTYSNARVNELQNGPIPLFHGKKISCNF